eukprot:TRINITY_DN7667_c0_g2_i1.p1 TRINITY_DN7667_c0_g2~~TRINITY_DN7667_c0_g2_i1.p1  ORF type:complete len:142 (+),score=5.31 TRINITY_DN7667_c0_g2_i1:191-616(+)
MLNDSDLPVEDAKPVKDPYAEITRNYEESMEELAILAPEKAGSKARFALTFNRILIRSRERQLKKIETELNLNIHKSFNENEASYSEFHTLSKKLERLRIQKKFLEYSQTVCSEYDVLTEGVILMVYEGLGNRRSCLIGIW